MKQGETRQDHSVREEEKVKPIERRKYKKQTAVRRWKEEVEKKGRGERVEAQGVGQGREEERNRV